MQSQNQNIQKRLPLKIILVIFLVLVHLGTLIGIIAVIGANSHTILGPGREIFTGELERGARIRILENDTAILQGFLDEVIEAFNAEFASYDIMAVDANQDNFIDLEQAGPFGFGPCVIFQANDRLMRFADGGHIFPLPIERLDAYEYISNEAWNAFFGFVDEIIVDDNGYPVIGEDGQPLRQEIPATLGVPVMIQGPVIYYRRSLVPEGTLDTWGNIYQFNRERNAMGGATRGYIRSLIDPYFNMGYLFSFGGYIFGENNTDPSTVGLSQNNAYRGVGVIRQLASSMDSRVTTHELTPLLYDLLAQGTVAATMTTPDVYTLFIDAFMRNGFTREEAIAELGVAPMPFLPECGDLTNPNPNLIPTIMMGGVNGYAISAWTDYPNAAFAFVNFATSFRLMERRHELLGIVPSREDVAEHVGGMSQIINEKLASGEILVMPGIREMAQVWNPVQSFFASVSQDAFRSFPRYANPSGQLAALVTLDSAITRAIAAIS